MSELHNAKILLVNTDTVPGLAVSPYHLEAVTALYELKERCFQKPLVWMVDDFSRISTELIVESYAEPLIKRYWPGALTLVFGVKPQTRIYAQLQSIEESIFSRLNIKNQKNNKLKSNYTPQYSLGVRIPRGDETLLALLKELRSPLAVTSVNRSGKKELTDLEVIKKQFGETGANISYLLYEGYEGGGGDKTNPKSVNKTTTNAKDKPLQVSTVIDGRTPELKVLRQGVVVVEK